MNGSKGSVSPQKAKQLLFEMRAEEIREELEAFWCAYVGFLLIIDAISPGVDADSELMP